MGHNGHRQTSLLCFQVGCLIAHPSARSLSLFLQGMNSSVMASTTGLTGVSPFPAWSTWAMCETCSHIWDTWYTLLGVPCRKRAVFLEFVFAEMRSRPFHSGWRLCMALDTLGCCLFLRFFYQSCFALTYHSPPPFWLYTSVFFWVYFTGVWSCIWRDSVECKCQ